MGKKNNSTSTKAKKVARQRRAATNRPPVSPAPLMAAEDPWADLGVEDEDDYNAAWDDITATYPTLLNALEGAQAGEVVELPGHDDGYSLRQLVRTDDGKVVFRETLAPDSDVRSLVATVLLNHPGNQARTEAALTAFLLEKIPSGVPRGQVEVVRLPGADDALFPQLGYQYEADVQHLQRWDELGPALEAFDPLILECLDSSGMEVVTETFAELRARGLRAVQCELCQEPLTDGHPDWSGVWVSLGDLGGPSCEQNLLRGAGGVYSIMVPGPHRFAQN
ncbi:hypothetical protein [Kitasatospora sp. NBC_01300]|uniref:hypothetical protein n=1 Tax=Kitasatospora sp. NBC_01300 TaxID=2903574 RepID=UPI002F91B817|nr:hypothetical protein OG556_40390 [Kitasatospora sp. NBC_01300]